MLLKVADVSGVAEARRKAVGLSRKLGANEAQAGRVGIISTELASNLRKHAGEGSLILQAFDDRDGFGIEMLAFDAGPGMHDIEVCLADGYSTTSSAGIGLGAVNRLSDTFAICSWPRGGTAAVARIRFSPPDKTRTFLISSASGSFPGEDVCGDAFAVQQQGSRCVALLADGSGHGELALQAANLAVQIFLKARSLPPHMVCAEIHEGLRATRGAAIGIADIDLAEARVAFCGLGNVSGMLISHGTARRMVSQNGTAGHVASRIGVFYYSFAERPCVVLHSDGLSARWNLDRYPGLAAAHPGLMASILFRDFRRGRDDATIVVMRG